MKGEYLSLDTAKKIAEKDKEIEILNKELEEKEDMLSKYRHLQTTTGIDELMGEIERLKQDNEYLNKVNIELSSRNTKATEYIKENICTFPAIPQGVYDLRNINLDKLLDILKGSDKE